MSSLLRLQGLNEVCIVLSLKAFFFIEVSSVIRQSNGHSRDGFCPYLKVGTLKMLSSRAKRLISDAQMSRR